MTAATEAEKALAVLTEALLAIPDAHARACLLAAADSWRRAATRAALRQFHEELAARHVAQDLGIG